MYKLIIADDEPTIRNGLARQIQNYGLPIEIAGLAQDGREALALCERIHPDILILDINMPHIDGLDLMERARAMLPESKMIVISGYDQFDYARRALQLSAFDYLLKPVNRAVLGNTLHEAVHSLERREKELTMLSELPSNLEDGDPLDRVLRQIHSRFSDPALSLTGMAESLHMSSATLSRGVKQRTGETFSDYVTRLRMEQAVTLLSSKSPIAIYDVAERVGYVSQHYFCRIFKKYTGQTPSDFRKAAREKNSD